MQAIAFGPDSSFHTFMTVASPRVSIICIMSENRVIARGGDQIWYIAEDLRHFKETTMGHPVIMGRKTFDSMDRQPLPGRTNIVVTSNRDYRPEGATVFHSVDEAIESAARQDPDEVFIVGGGEIYRQTMPRVDRLYLTIVEGSVEGDTYFPDYSEFSRVMFEKSGASEGYRYRFLTLERPAG